MADLDTVDFQSEITIALTLLNFLLLWFLFSIQIAVYLISGIFLVGYFYSSSESPAILYALIVLTLLLFIAL